MLTLANKNPVSYGLEDKTDPSVWCPCRGPGQPGCGHPSSLRPTVTAGLGTCISYGMNVTVKWP